MADANIPEIDGFWRVVSRYEEIHPNTGKILDLARHLKSLGHAEVVVECIEITIMQTYRPLSKFHFFELLDAFFGELNDRSFNDIFSKHIADVFAHIYRTANGHQRQHMLKRLGAGPGTWFWSFTDGVIKHIHEAVHRVDPQYTSQWLQTQTPQASAASRGAAPTSAKNQKQARKLDAFAQLGHTLRVSNLTQQVNRETLRAHFGEYGQCVVNIPYSFNSVKGVAASHGYALVRYQSQEEAEQARQGLDGAELDGRRISVSHYGGAPAAEVSAPDRDDDSGQQQQRFRVYVNNLATSVDNYRLRELFAELNCSEKDTFVAWDKAANRSRGYGCVVFNDLESAKRAVKAMDGADVAGRTISVNMDLKKLPSESTQVCVYKIPPDLNPKKLRELFEPFGEVLGVWTPFDKTTGQSSGYTFVTFADADAALRARDEMDGAIVDNCRIEVELNFRQLADSSFSVFVMNLTPDMNRSKLRDAFAHLGAIRSVHTPMDPRSGQSRGFGFVFFEEHESARRAVAEVNGQYLQGRQIWVRWNDQNPSNGGSNEHTSRSPPPNLNRSRLSQSASSSDRHAQTSSADAGAEARPSPFLQSLLQAASGPSYGDAQSTEQQDARAGSGRFRPRNKLAQSTPDSPPSARTEPETSQFSSSANAISAAPQTPAPATHRPTTTPAQPPPSGQPSTPKRNGYVSQRLRRMRFPNEAPVADPTLSPIRETPTSVSSSTGGSQEAVTSAPAPDAQVAREEDQSVGSVLPFPTAVRVHRMPNQVAGVHGTQVVNERYYLFSGGERSSRLIQFLSAQAGFAQGHSLSRKTVVLVSDASERDSTVLELFARVSNALVSSEHDVVSSCTDGLAVLVASMSDFSAQFFAEFATIVFLCAPEEGLISSIEPGSNVSSLSVYVFGDSSDVADKRRIGAISDVR